MPWGPFSALLTQRSASSSPFRRRTLGHGVRRILEYMILHDNWQGEFSVALFGAIGLAAISILTDGEYLNRPQVALLGHILSPHWWEAWFLTFGAMQLYGLFRNQVWFRVAGAAMVFKGMLELLLVLLIVTPWALSLAFLGACIFIEFCAIVFHTATIVRHRAYPRWKWTTKR